MWRTNMLAAYILSSGVSISSSNPFASAVAALAISLGLRVKYKVCVSFSLIATIMTA
jgi:hypothetical protein